MKYKNIQEGELKNKIGKDFFNKFDTSPLHGAIDFTVLPKQNNLFGREPLLWAEAKTGNFNLLIMFTQLILTIGKARAFDKITPPAFLGAFDFKKIAFIPYINIQDIFYENDFNWKVTPSNHETKEFLLIKQRVESILNQNMLIFDYEKDEKELHAFINNNVANATTTSKLKIDKNNFIPIYLKWLEIVKPTIDVNWEDLKKINIMDSDFYLADLFVNDKDTQNIEDDLTIRDNLFVVFQNQGYKIAKENIKQMFDATINLKNKNTYIQFWKRYKRPPLKESEGFIIERKDLLVSQDIRERQGAFFTPRIWVELSQKYITDYLGENWQDEYYIWDCAAGTGNLLAGLNNKYNIYASTFFQADVNAMHDRIDNGANLLKNNVFQFDFLEDDFTKLPQSLQDIINNKEKRKKLIIYINPPYAEATSAKTVTGTGENKIGVTTKFEFNEQIKPKIGNASNEIFALFMAKINEKIPDCILGQFSTLKFVNGSNFIKFKEYFLAEYQSGFIVPADTFDNVKGKFPIGFTLWDTGIKSKIKTIKTDIFNKNGDYEGAKFFHGELTQNINRWIKSFEDTENKIIGLIVSTAPDFQHNNQLCILSKKQKRYCFNITNNNLINTAIYFSVRNCIDASWINDRDQYTYPIDGWQDDLEFQNDSLVFTLFNSQNKTVSTDGLNLWIPFTEYEVNAQAKFANNNMTDFIKAKDLKFSDEATMVFDAGRELWKYYHAQKDVNVNASLYDIREYFQGRNEKGRMNSKSEDAVYMKLIGELRSKLSILADKIKPKVYEYKFLKE